MKKVSWSAVSVGIGMLAFALLQSTTGHPPYTIAEAAIFAALLVTISAMGGFEWGLVCLLLQAFMAWFLRDAVFSAFIITVVALGWYGGVILLAAHGSRVLMGIASAMLFAGLLLERMPTFGVKEWMIFFACFLLEISGMYFAGNVLRGRWFSPYA